MPGAPEAGQVLSVQVRGPLVQGKRPLEQVRGPLMQIRDLLDQA